MNKAGTPSFSLYFVVFKEVETGISRSVLVRKLSTHVKHYLVMAEAHVLSYCKHYFKILQIP